MQLSELVRDRSRSSIATAVIVLALLATACSGGDDSSTSTTTEDGGDTEEQAAELEPTPGGEITFAVEADTDGWNPVLNLLPISGMFVGSSFYDSLAYETGDGDLEMGLAESIEPNEDATVWSITLKDGITFHDGTPLDAATLIANFEGRLANPLTSAALDPIEEIVEIDPSTVEVRMDRPWSGYDHTLAAPGGLIVSLANAQDTTGTIDPIGTGPFRFVEWVPNSHLEVERNPDYWQEPAHLDGIRFEFVPDTTSRENALLAGDVDGLITNEGSSILSLRTADGIESFEHASEATHVMLNTAVAPFDNPLARQALAYGTNQEALLVALGSEDVTVPADTAFISTNPWHLEDNGYPEFDPDMAEDLAAQYEAETGDPIRFDFIAGQGILDKDANALVEQWGASGIEASLVPTDQAQLINDAFTGNYQAAMFRNHNWIDPDFNYIFWIGGGGINFTNISNPDLDEALEAGRATLDQDVRAETYDEVQLKLNELLPEIWLYETPWMLAHQDDVHGWADIEERGMSRVEAKRFWPDVWVQQ